MKFWLFEKEADVLWQRKRLRRFSAWRLAALMGVSVCWGLALLLLAEGNYPVEYLLTYVRTPLIAVLNVLPVVLLSLLGYAIFARALPAFLLSGVVTFGFSAANYYLLRFRDDPLMALDLLDFSTAVHFTDEYSLAPDKRLWAMIACFGLALLFLGLFARGKGAGKKLRLSILALLLLTAYPLGLLYTSDEVYDDYAADLIYSCR